MQSVGESNKMLAIAEHPKCGLAGITTQQHRLGSSEGIAMQGQSIATLPFPFWPYQLAI